MTTITRAIYFNIRTEGLTDPGLQSTFDVSLADQPAGRLNHVNVGEAVVVAGRVLINRRLAEELGLEYALNPVASINRRQLYELLKVNVTDAIQHMERRAGQCRSEREERTNHRALSIARKLIGLAF